MCKCAMWCMFAAFVKGKPEVSQHVTVPLLEWCAGHDHLVQLQLQSMWNAKPGWCCLTAHARQVSGSWLTVLASGQQLYQGLHAGRGGLTAEGKCHRHPFQTKKAACNFLYIYQTGMIHRGLAWPSRRGDMHQSIVNRELVSSKHAS